MHYCHQKRIIHRDLKLNNIVFASPNSREIRVVDFGISGLYAANNADKSLAGSLKYMAPEILTGENTAADPAIDIFSMGVILFSLVTGKLPFDGKDTNTIRNKIIKSIYQYPSNSQVSKSCRNLIDEMLLRDPKQRIKMKQIFKHEWITPMHRKLNPMNNIHSDSLNSSLNSKISCNSQSPGFPDEFPND